jgi:hypothetical protein
MAVASRRGSTIMGMVDQWAQLATFWSIQLYSRFHFLLITIPL